MNTPIQLDYERLREETHEKYPEFVEILDKLYVRCEENWESYLSNFYFMLTAGRTPKRPDGSPDFVRAFTSSCHFDLEKAKNDKVYAVWNDRAVERNGIFVSQIVMYTGWLYEMYIYPNRYYHIGDQFGAIEKTFVNHRDCIFTEKIDARNFARFLLCYNRYLDMIYKSRDIDYYSIQERGYKDDNTSNV